jgi:NIMA (never in mitosis gene a)-related kinase
MLTTADRASDSSTCLKDFQQVKLLGEGAFAAVYKVIRHADGETYALKKVKVPSLSEKEKQNALNEIRLLASVQHENIISYKDAFFDDRTRCLCIVTDVADSGDLMAQIVRCQKSKSHIAEIDIWRYLIGLARALQVLHNASIFHRDMKSANVFLSKSRNGTIAKLGDFNVSTVAKQGLCLTQTGTPYYASPEIWRDMPYDGKSDIWGLGCVMYEAAALKPPFRANDMEGLYKKVLQGKFSRIPNVFSTELSDTIAALLQVNPRYRPSATQLLQLPVVLKHTDECGLGGVSSGTSNLLSTIKVPKKLIDLSAHLPQAQYGTKALADKSGCDGATTAESRLAPLKLPSLMKTPEKCLKVAQRRKGKRRMESLPSLHQCRAISKPQPEISEQCDAKIVRERTPEAASNPHSGRSEVRSKGGRVHASLPALIC